MSNLVWCELLIGMCKVELGSESFCFFRGRGSRWLVDISKIIIENLGIWYKEYNENRLEEKKDL